MANPQRPEDGRAASPNAGRNAAVALSYDEADGAPRVVAKGYGQLADTIVRTAEENGLYVHESRELVGLLMQVDLDAHIPPQLYVAVAELLAWLYRLESREIPADATPPDLYLRNLHRVGRQRSGISAHPAGRHAFRAVRAHPPRQPHPGARRRRSRDRRAHPGADKHTRQFFWRPRDYAGADFEQSDSMGLLSGTTFHFHATAYGACRSFRVQRPDVIHFDDGSAAWCRPSPTAWRGSSGARCSAPR